MFLRFSCFFYFFIFVFPSSLFANEWAELPSLLPKGTQVSYLVVDPQTNKVVAHSQQAVLRTPASILKLLTATEAKVYLGESFRYYIKVSL